MDRQWLERELAAGSSIAAIARELGRDASVVAYWANKYGLSSSHRSPHAARGGISRTQLRSLVERGLSTREIAGACRCSQTTVRYWLGRWGLQTQPARYWRRDQPKPDEILRECRIHGWTTFRRAGCSSAYRCTQCGPARVARRRRRIKEILVAEAGGACQRCGYDRYAGALQFHHLDPSEKTFGFSDRGVTRSLARLREEARKCVLLCANCHAEVEAGYASVDVSRAQDGPG